LNTTSLRRARYQGKAKVHLQHVATVAAINLDRVDNWQEDVPQARRGHPGSRGWRPGAKYSQQYPAHPGPDLITEPAGPF
jgi:hypothetical protein